MMQLAGLAWIILCAVAAAAFVVGRHWRNDEHITLQLENIHLRGRLAAEEQRNRDLLRLSKVAA